MKIELKNVKHSESLSHETNAFTATLYVDGQRTAHVENTGHGGATVFGPVFIGRGSDSKRDPAAAARLESAIEYAETERGDEIYNGASLDELVDDLLMNHLHRKDMLKLMRSKIVFTEKGQLVTMGYKGCRSLAQIPAAQLEKTKQRLRSEDPSCQILNDMDTDDALRVYLDLGVRS